MSKTYRIKNSGKISLDSKTAGSRGELDGEGKAPSISTEWEFVVTQEELEALAGEMARIKLSNPVNREYKRTASPPSARLVERAMKAHGPFTFATLSEDVKSALEGPASGLRKKLQKVEDILDDAELQETLGVSVDKLRKQQAALSKEIAEAEKKWLEGGEEEDAESEEDDEA